jgi:hypothetical protein
MGRVTRGIIWTASKRLWAGSRSAGGEHPAVGLRSHVPEITAAGTPIAAFVPLPGIPVYVHVLVGLSGPCAYVINRCLISLLAWKALDKIEAGRVAELMTTVTGIPGTMTDPTSRRPEGATGAAERRSNGSRSS